MRKRSARILLHTFHEFINRVDKYFRNCPRYSRCDPQEYPCRLQHYGHCLKTESGCQFTFSVAPACALFSLCAEYFSLERHGLPPATWIILANGYFIRVFDVHGGRQVIPTITFTMAGIQFWSS